MLRFANWVKPEDLYNPDNTAKYIPRVAVDASIPGQWTCSLVPPPTLAHGVVDEGSWPRIVVLDGEQIVMQRDEWDMLKLKGTHVCYIPQKGFPPADKKRRRSVSRDDVPELDSDSESDASSEGAATPRASPSTPSTSFTALPLPDDDDDDAGLRPGSPMQSVVSRICSAMSVDTHSLASSTSYMSVDTVRPCDVSSTGAPNPHGKRAKVPAHEHPDSPPRKRVHGQRPVYMRRAVSARAQRRAQREAFTRRRTELRHEAEQAALLAEAAIQAQNLRAAEAHKRELEEKRARLQQMDEDERLAQQMYKHLEQERKKADEALAKRRHQPEALAPEDALRVWRKRVNHFKTLHNTKEAIHVRDLPFPVLFSPEYSLHLVTQDSVKDFFVQCIPMMTAHELKKARFALHDTHYRGKKYTAGEHYMDEADTDFVIRTMTCVAAFVNDNYDELKEHCKPETA